MKKSKSKSKKVFTPHDKFFKKSLENPEAARHFIQHYLPKEMLALMNLDTLELQHITFIDEDFKSSACDVIFRINTLDGQEAYIYALLEHQRKPEKMMPFRLLKYIVRLFDLHLTKHNTESLPLIVPLVIYNGETTPYPYSMDIFDLFSPSLREKAKSALLGPYPLLDLSHYDTREIKDDAWIALLLNALKYGPSKKIPPKTLVEYLDFALVTLAARGDLVYIEGAVRYLNEVQEVEAQDELWDRLQEALQPILGEDYMMSIADSLRHEGMQAEAMQIAKNFLESGFGIEVVAKNTGLDIGLLQKLQAEVKH